MKPRILIGTLAVAGLALGVGQMTATAVPHHHDLLCWYLRMHAFCPSTSFGPTSKLTVFRLADHVALQLRKPARKDFWQSAPSGTFTSCTRWTRELL